MAIASPLFFTHIRPETSILLLINMRAGMQRFRKVAALRLGNSGDGMPARQILRNSWFAGKQSEVFGKNAIASAYS